MCKTSLQSEQAVTDAAYVERAATWANWLTQSEARGPGDRENAWRRLETKYGITFGAFWALRYRRPKAILTSIYFRLQAAYEAECQRQLRKLQHEIEITKAIAGADHAVVASIEAVVDEAGD